jgi:hypothetical protein
VGSEELDQASGLAADRRPRRLTANHNTTVVRQQRSNCRRTSESFRRAAFSLLLDCISNLS